MPRKLICLLLLGALLPACSGDEPGAESPGSKQGAETPGEAIESLFSLLSDGEFIEAAPLAIPDQAALASLAEGASAADVAEALRDGDEIIAANFWSGFAQSVDDLLTQGVEVMEPESASAEGVEFSVVPIRTGEGELRHMATRDVDGYRVDLFATFGPALAGRLYPQVESLFETEGEDASLVLGGLRDQVPSLYIASQTPDLAPNVVQDILQLIELITRIN